MKVLFPSSYQCRYHTTQMETVLLTQCKMMAAKVLLQSGKPAQTMQLNYCFK